MWYLTLLLLGGCGGPDADGDGVPDDFDCAPDDDRRFPGNPEVCNGLDDDCDGSTFEAGANVGGAAFTTLAEAVDAAGDGDTVSVCAGSYTENLVVSRDLTLESYDGAGTTVLDGGLGGSVIFVGDGADLTLRGLTLTGGSGTTTSDPALGDGAFGGGIYAFGAGMLTIEDSSLTGNSAAWGGGVAVSTSEGLSIQDSTFLANSATGGDAGGVGVVDVDSLGVVGAAFAENTAAGGGTALAALYVAESCTLSQVEATSNGPVADVAYGAILVALADCTIADSTLADNHGTEGGGLVISDATVALERTGILRNTAGWGGGVAMWSWDAGGDGNPGATLEMDESSVIEQNTAWDTVNIADGGGGIAAWTYASEGMLAGGPIRISGGTVRGNLTDGGGGGIFYWDQSGSGELVVDGVTIDDNASLGEGGGGLELLYLGYTEGGGPDVTIQGSDIRGNTAGSIDEEQGYVGGGGGVLGWWVGSLRVTDSTIAYNGSNEGGGIAAYGLLDCEVTRSVIESNEGGLQGGGLELQARADGAGILIPASCTFTDSTLASNAAGFGGAIWASGALSLTRTTLTGNGADFAGAIGLYDMSTGSQVTLSADAESAVSGNSAWHGGGLALFSDGPEVSVTVTGLEVSGNSGGYGGGIEVVEASPGRCGTFHLDGVTVSGNEGVYGGGLSVGCPTALDGSTVRGNVATTGGGALLTGAGTLASSATTWTGNTPEDLWVAGLGYTGSSGTFSCSVVEAGCTGL